MSVMEKTLRQIDEQRQTSRQRAAPEDYLAPDFPAPPAPRDLRHAVWLTVVACAAALGWYLASPGTPKANAPAPTAQAEAAATAAVAVASAAAPLPAPSASAPLDEAPAWLVQASHVWAAGLHQEATRLWLDGLRTMPPSTLALLVADRQTLPQAKALHKQWSKELPLIVLAQASDAAERWMVLALPPAPQIDQVQQRLSAGRSSPVAWATVAQWVAAFPPANAIATPVAPHAGPASAPAVAVAVPVAKPPAASAPAPVPLPAPPVQAAANSKPADKPTENKAPAPASPGPAPTKPAQAAASPATDAPRISRAEPDNARSAAATRVIDADFQGIEQLLARGEHGQALDSALKLEQQIGANWRTRYLAGVALSGQGRWSDAVAALGDARQKNPAHARVALYLAVALQENKDHAHALEVLASALERHPDTPELWLNQGHSLQALGRKAEAGQAYQRFLTLSATRADLQVQRDWVQSRLSKDS